MKHLQWILPSLFSFFLLTSCKKDKDQVTTSPSSIAGMYEGKYGTGNNNPSSFYSFNLNADGTMQEINNSGGVVGTGTWTMDGKTFRATYHYTFPATAFFALTGTYNASTKNITGTWGYGNSDSDGGKWSMTKK